MWQGYYEYVVNQWGVGHGGLNSQSVFFQAGTRKPTSLVGDGSRVRVVYDCGSGGSRTPRTSLAHAVSRMLETIDAGSKIDLLVISHFDQDHVNGLEHLSDELAKKDISVDRVWAPVLTKIEALFALAQSGLTGFAQQDYAAFLADPEARFGELFEGADVTLIDSESEPIPPPVGGETLEDGPSGSIVLEAVVGGRGLVARAGGRDTGEVLWEIQPYLVESSLVGARAVSSTVSRRLGKPAEKCTLADLIQLATDRKLLDDFHAAVLGHHQRLQRGTRASSARTGSNLSSLCVYSGPVSPYRWCRYRKGWDLLDTSRHVVPNAPSWLGTGDSGLMRGSNVDHMRSVLTPNRLDRVGVVSAPHHGSRLDSGRHLWDALPNAQWVTIEANMHPNRSPRVHPHVEVLNELASRYLWVHVASDSDDFHWRDKGIR